MPPRRFDIRENSSITSKDNVDGAHPTLEVQTRSRNAASNFLVESHQTTLILLKRVKLMLSYLREILPMLSYVARFIC